MISSCHSIFLKSLPPTNAVAVYSLNFFKEASISLDPCSRAGVRVPSTSNIQMTFGCFRSANGLIPFGNTFAGVVVAMMYEWVGSRWYRLEYYWWESTIVLVRVAS